MKFFHHPLFALFVLTVFFSGCGIERKINLINARPSPDARQVFPVGEWRSSIDPAHIMTLTGEGRSLTMAWSPTIDSDIEISGTLINQGDDKTFIGEVDFSSGDEPRRKKPLTIIFDPVTQVVRLELKNMWTEPLVFERVGALVKKTCAETAQDIVAESDYFEELVQKNKGLKLMEGRSDMAGEVYEVRAFIESPDGDTATIEHFRVDFSEKAFLIYDPIEDEFRRLSEGPALIEKRADCVKRP